MKRIAYADVVVGTDPRLAELVVTYATELAKLGSADSVTIPARVGWGPVQPVSLVLGPASQITVTDDGEPFGQDVGEAVADLERRLEQLSTSIPQSGEAGSPDLDELEALMPQDVDDR